MITSVKIAFLFIFLQISLISFAQVTPQPPSPPASADTVKEFEILRGPSMRSIYVDSVTSLQTIAGGAIIKQGTTIFSGDSIVINPNTHVVEAFGNVHINQADSVQTYAQYLKYIGTEKTAYLKKDVKLIDKKGNLFTQDLDYNLGTGIGNYHNGGKVINGKTTITSEDGVYYADTKDIYFKNNVVVVEPKNHITTDSLLYNLQSQKSNFTGNTFIKNKEVDIHTTQGTYDFNTGNALFTSRTTIKDSSNRIYIANNMAIDKKSGIAQLEGNAIVKDSANGFIALANQIFLNNKNNSFLATRKPVLIIKQKNDSIYVAADTIYSGYTMVVKNEGFILKKDSVINDSSQMKLNADSSKISDSSSNIIHVDQNLNKDSVKIISPISDSLKMKQNIIHNDTIPKPKEKIIAAVKDSLKIKERKIDEETIHKPEEKVVVHDSATINPIQVDSVSIDSLKSKVKGRRIESLDSLKTIKKDTLQTPDSSRYFLAFHHVRIFSDSLQSVCDSLFFSAKDSVFRLYYDPVIWSGHSQINGDTIFLYTKNKKPERLYVFDKGMIVNKTTQGFYNQISGKTINGYFVNGAIDYMRVRGSQAESIYYAQDEDSAYIGMNRATGDVIDIFFKNDDLKKVLFVNDIKGKMYPMNHIPDDQKFLKNFIWLNDKRPKNKLELFE